MSSSSTVRWDRSVWALMAVLVAEATPLLGQSTISSCPTRSRRLIASNTARAVETGGADDALREPDALDGAADVGVGDVGVRDVFTEMDPHLEGGLGLERDFRRRRLHVGGHVTHRGTSG